MQLGTRVIEFRSNRADLKKHCKRETRSQCGVFSPVVSRNGDLEQTKDGVWKEGSNGSPWIYQGH